MGRSVMVPRKRRTYGVAALVAITLGLLPAPAPAAGAHSYAALGMDGWVKRKGYLVTAEAVHTPQEADTVGVPDPPEPEDPMVVTGDAVACLIADSGLVTKGRVRTAVREEACPVRLSGFRYDLEAFEASLTGVVRTRLWTRRWEVRRDRWKLVRDTTVKRKARVDLTWRWSERPVFGFEPCGGGFASATGMGGPATVSGSIRFRGIGITAKIPAGKTGTKFLGICVTPL